MRPSAESTNSLIRRGGSFLGTNPFGVKSNSIVACRSDSLRILISLNKLINCTSNIPHGLFQQSDSTEHVLVDQTQIFVRC